MKKLIFTIAIAVIATTNLTAQTGASINTTGTAADASAILDVSSTSQGMLVPRLALTATTDPSPITNPANSLIVYNTATTGDVTPGFYYWEGSKWVQLSSAASLNADLRAIKTKIYTNVGGR